MTAQRGTELHKLAHDLIRLGVKLPRNQTTLSMYVNDAIGYRMSTEQPLYYSDNCFGTTDAISYRRNKLRIFDLKNGVTPAKITQLEVYAALFCLEYMLRPVDIEMEFRIYQNDAVEIYPGDPVMITYIMERIVTADKRITELRMEAYE